MGRRLMILALCSLLLGTYLVTSILGKGGIQPLSVYQWIHGYVFDDSTSERIQGALVEATQGNDYWSDTTDYMGYYRLDVGSRSGQFDMVVSKDGYQTQTTTVYKEEDEELEKDFYLVPNNPHYTPSNPSPSNGATGQATSLTLTWSGGDPDEDSVTYHVYFSTSSPPGYDTDTTSPSLAKSGLDEGTTYYWKIVSEDEHGANATGPEWSFTTSYGEEDHYFLDEPFTSLAAWDEHVSPYFGVNIDQGKAHIYEITGKWRFNAYIWRVINISNWRDSMTLELDWRAKSNYQYSSVTNAYVRFFNSDTSEEVGSVTLVAGGTYDTGWQHRVEDVTSFMDGVSSLEVRLEVRDAWAANWHQEAWFDNVQLYGGYNHPPNPPYGPAPPNKGVDVPRSLTLNWSCRQLHPGLLLR